MTTRAPDPNGEPTRHAPPPVPGSRSAGLWAVIVAILIPPVVIPLLVGLYDKPDPKLAGFPFYFWFQFALILFSAALTVLAYYIATVADRRDREATR